MLLSYNHLNKLSKSINNSKELFESPESLKAALNQMGLEVEAMDKTADGDVVIEVDTTPNRPDHANYVGVLREVAAVKMLETNFEFRISNLAYRQAGFE